MITTIAVFFIWLFSAERTKVAKHDSNEKNLSTCGKRKSKDNLSIIIDKIKKFDYTVVYN
ncbi:hypothetical protein DBT48_08770 [Aerococcus mictus]|nr:hypothetical protein HMPREF2680_03365 [Aerococcus mictus]PKY82320.1 hypothetical protein CYJ31_07005 [Aerococcus mictus]PMB93333.1 hypothetical protein CK795_06975 [Aerococcus mictus]RAV62504.1 hypothetical protein DBT35_08055 [Aerococcus mictus]RAV69415.1 hypothetical protein DBT47_09285 [Aerococcus mictus]